MAKMNIFAVVSNRVLIAIKQSRILISELSLGSDLALVLKNLANAIGLSDAIAKLLGKGINDPAQAADLVAKSVQANKIDSSVAGDLLEISIGKAISDQATFAETHAKAVSKGIFGGLNTAITSDSIIREAGYNRAFNHTVSISDQIIIEFVVPLALSDSALASDSLQSIVAYNRGFNDGVDGLDVQGFSVGSGYVDSGSVGDQADLVAGFNRSFESSVIATDDIGGEATLDDNQTIQFFKQLTNLFYATDSAVRFAGKVVNDILTAADSGTLLNQDYVDDPFYFAEDYVGVKRTF